MENFEQKRNYEKLEKPVFYSQIPPHLINSLSPSEKYLHKSSNEGNT